MDAGAAAAGPARRARPLPRVVAALAGIAIGIAIGTVSGCAPGAYAPPGGARTAGPGAMGLRHERQVIGDFADVQAVAASRRYVFVFADGGVGIYDRQLEAWLPPLTREQGLGDERVTALAADPVEDAVWFGVPGAVLSYRPQLDLLQRTIVVGVPDLIAFERGGTGDALVRSGGQWTRVSRTGQPVPLAGRAPNAASLVLPGTLDEVYRRFPGLRSQQLLLLRDATPNRPLRSWPVASASFSPDRASEVWLGTAGDGLWRVDPTFQQATPLRFGLHERGVGALAPAADGVWAAGLGRSAARGGLTFASDDLQRWRWIDGTIAEPLVGVLTRALAVRGSIAWLGTDRGVVRVRLDGALDVARWSTLDGLPADRVFAVAPRDGGAWAGTALGLVWIADTSDARDPRGRGIGERWLDEVAVRALQSIGDTLWIGSDAGLVALPAGATSMARPVGADPALRRPIRAMAWSDTMLLVATDDALLHLAPRGGREPSRLDGVDPRQVGQVTQLAIDERTIWIAGSEGVLVLNRATGGQRLLRVGPQLPAPALDVVAGRDWLWIATPEGLVRWRRAADGGVP
jgi:hypothetical protein